MVAWDQGRAGFCQRLREITPEINGAQRIMQQDDRRAIAVSHTPLADKHASAGNRDERVKNLSAHCKYILSPNGSSARLPACNTLSNGPANETEDIWDRTWLFAIFREAR